MVLFNLCVPRPPCSVTSPWVKLRSPQAPSPSSCPGAAPAFQSLRLGSALSPPHTPHPGCLGSDALLSAPLLSIPRRQREEPLPTLNSAH